MIETTNNIIFWIGYTAVASILGVIAMAGFYDIFLKLMKSKWFFIQIFNAVYERRLKGLSEKDFKKWHDELKEKYERVKNSKV